NPPSEARHFTVLDAPVNQKIRFTTASCAKNAAGRIRPAATSSRSGEHDLVALHLAFHAGAGSECAGEYLLRQRVFDPALNRAFERSRAIHRVVANRDQPRSEEH